MGVALASASLPRIESDGALMVRLANTLALLLFASTAAYAGAPGPQYAPPGMSEIAQAGTGRVFTTTFSGSNSATALMKALITGIAPHFDSAPQLNGAVANRADNQAQAAFSATMNGAPVRGIIIVNVAQGVATGYMVLDYAQQLAQSIGPMMQQLAPQIMGGAPAGANNAPRPVPQLQTVQIPDGSGTVGLPPGWRIRNAYNGAVDIDGPNGVYLGLAGRTLYTTAQYAQMFPDMFYVSSLEPGQAIMDIAQQNTARGAPTQAQILSNDPVPSQNGQQAAFLRVRQTTQGTTYDIFGYYSLAQTDVSQVVGYYTLFQGPPGVFDQLLPEALAIWGSWSANPQFLTARLMDAANKYRQAGETYIAGNAETQRMSANASAAWSQYMRGTTTLESVENGTRVRETVNSDFGRYWVEQFPNDYREVPTNELVPR